MKTVFVISAIVLLLAVCASAQTEVSLLAGQQYNAGWITAVANFGILTIDINTENGWVLEETHVYVGIAPPRKSAPGRFPYKHENLPANSTTDSYRITLTDVGAVCGSDLYIAVHAVVMDVENGYGEETAWGEGSYIRAGKNWAMYFKTPVICPQPR